MYEAAPLLPCRTVVVVVVGAKTWLYTFLEAIQLAYCTLLLAPCCFPIDGEQHSSTYRLTCASSSPCPLPRVCLLAVCRDGAAVYVNYRQQFTGVTSGGATTASRAVAGRGPFEAVGGGRTSGGKRQRNGGGGGQGGGRGSSGQGGAGSGGGGKTGYWLAEGGKNVRHGQACCPARLRALLLTCISGPSASARVAGCHRGCCLGIAAPTTTCQQLLCHHQISPNCTLCLQSSPDVLHELHVRTVLCRRSTLMPGVRSCGARWPTGQPKKSKGSRSLQRAAAGANARRRAPPARPDAKARRAVRQLGAANGARSSRWHTPQYWLRSPIVPLVLTTFYVFLFACLAQLIQYLNITL